MHIMVEKDVLEVGSSERPHHKWHNYSFNFALGFFLGPVAFKILIGAVAILAYKEIITLPKVMDKLNLPIIILGLIGFMALIYIVNDGYALYLGVSYQTIAFLLFGMVIPTIFSKNMIRKHRFLCLLYYFY